MTSYGTKYDKQLSTTDIAKRFREDVKEAKKSGELPGELRLSVKTKYFSQGSSIDVSIVAWPDNLLIFNPERIVLEHENPATFHDEANQYSATSCHEAMTDLGGNLQWPRTKASGNPDQPCVAGMDFADPLLQSLADNGGFSMTFALGPGSPAIDRAADCPATDQRGQPRGTLCDTGAYEAQP